MHFLLKTKKYLSSHVFLVAGLVSVVMVTLVNFYGPGLTYDSIDYLKASQHPALFLSGQPIEGQVVQRPPVFPVFINLLNKLPLLEYHIINVLLIILNTWVFFRILKPLPLARNTRLLFYVLFCFGMPVHLAHAFLWTESFVMLLILLQVYILIHTRRGIGASLIWIIAGTVAVLTKNGYMLIVPVFMLSRLLITRKFSDYILSALYGLSAYVAFNLWAAIVDKPSGEALAFRTGSMTLEYVNVVTAWFLPMVIPLPWRIIVVGGVATVLLLIFLRREYYDFNLTWVFGFLFVLYFAGRSYYSHVDYQESEQYLSVVYPVFLLFGAGIFDKVRHTITLRGIRVIELLAWGWAVYMVVRVVKNDIFWISDRWF